MGGAFRCREKRGRGGAVLPPVPTLLSLLASPRPLLGHESLNPRLTERRNRGYPRSWEGDANSGEAPLGQAAEPEGRGLDAPAPPAPT